MTTRISRGRRLTCPYGPMVDPPFLQPISVEPHSNAIKSHSTTLKSREVPLNHHKPPLNKLKSHEVPLNHHKPLKSYLSSIVFPNKSTIFFQDVCASDRLADCARLGDCALPAVPGRSFGREGLILTMKTLHDIYGKWHV